MKKKQKPRHLQGISGMIQGEPPSVSDGFVLLYKRMEVQGRFRWPRNQLEVKQLTWQQFDWLMSGLEIEQPKAFKPTE